jgi:hypothetical protein
MQISTLNRLSRVCALLITVLLFTIASCGKNGPKVDYPKVHDPAEISNQCAGNVGFDEQLSLGLAAALRQYDGKVDDEFKLRAMMLVSDSDSVPTSARDSLLKEYFSCLDNSAKK